MTPRRLALGLGALLALAQPARALTFSFSVISGDTLTTSQAAAFQTAANVWSSFLADSITVNLKIGFAALGSNVLGGTTPTIVFGTGFGVKSLLAADAKDATDTQAVASLSNTNPTQIAVTAAEAKALGGTLPNGITSDGSIEFSTGVTFSETRAADGSIAAGTYDLIGIAEHEIGHLLGFDSSVDGGTSGVLSLLDLFRYGAANTRSATAGAAAYFSIDSGLTNIADFSVGGSGNDQASHWSQATNGVMRPEAAAGQTQNITALDVKALDVIGYDVRVPEPWSVGLLTVGVLGAIGARRRRR